MPDTELLIERLAAENHEFRRMRDDHRRYDEELSQIQSRAFLTAEQQWRVSELKKLKLIAKDRMEAMIRQARPSARA